MLAGTLEYGPSFKRHVDAVRDGADPHEVAATWYVPRNADRRRRDVFARLLETAASVDGEVAQRDRLLAVCQTSSARALDERDRPKREVGDRQSALQERWRLTVRDGARLLALRGASRCLSCEQGLADPYRTGYGTVVDERRVRADYCDVCERNGRADRIRSTHAEAIRQALDAADGAVRRPQAPRPPACTRSLVR